MANYDLILHVSAVAALIFFAWLGVLLTAFTLPGIWIAIAAAALIEWWYSERFGTDLFSWWTLAACAALAILAEIAEIAASAFGASKVGGSKKAAFASVIGAILGAILGTFLLPIPILGTVFGAAVGAGGAALLTEKHLGEKSWKDASKVGAGAAAGRLIATLFKVGVAAVVALILTVAAFV